MEPQEFERRVLVAVTGLSPQVITETLYALVKSQNPSYVPTEIHILTTEAGAQSARDNLLSDSPGWFERLRKDYDLPEITFTAEQIHVIEDNKGRPMTDIRTPEENAQVADFITEFIQSVADDADASIHATIAGGRKTMGYYLGYAMSLFGRTQDRLSHVLVSERFESHRDFYYPTPYESIILTRGPKPEPLDAQKAEVTLANIPFVMLRPQLLKRVQNNRVSFRTAVEAAQPKIDSQELVIDYKKDGIFAGDVFIKMTPRALAFIGWMARRVLEGDGPIITPPTYTPKPNYYSESYMKEYDKLYKTHASTEKLFRGDGKTNDSAAGMDKGFFERAKNAVNKDINVALNEADAAHFIIGICEADEKGEKGHALRLSPDNIRIIAG